MLWAIIGIAGTALAISILLAILLGYTLFILWERTEKIYLPRLSECLAYIFYKPISTLSRKHEHFDRYLIECENRVMQERFRRVRGKKILVAPQCLRAGDCPATLDPKMGYICKDCGRCVIAKLSKEAKKLGFEFYIVPGDSFVKRIAKERKPAGAIGIACTGELSRTLGVGMRMGVASAGVPLLRDGCFMTEVDPDAVLEKMRECGSLQS